MKIKIGLIAVLLGLLSMTNGFAQKATTKTAPKAAGTKFTSVYTSLSKNCKTLPGSNGSDDAAICKGAGDYQVRHFYSAASTHFVAELKGNDEVAIDIATLSVGYEQKNTVLEWRLANGKPFAVIMRVPTYAEPVGDEQYFGKVNGQKLVVVGLIGFEETVSGEVNANKANANVKARALADKAYAAIPK